MAQKPVSIFLPITNRERLVARVVYDGPVSAPVEEGHPDRHAARYGSATR